jgi:hypothetical protein
MTTFGESIYGGVITCRKIIAQEADLPSSGGGGGTIDVSGVNFDNKWSISLDNDSNFFLTNNLVNVVGLSGNAHTGKITLYDFKLDDIADVDTTIKDFGSFMYYDSIQQKYEFTDKVRFLGVSLDVSSIPIVTSAGDLRLFNDDTSANIFLGGYTRTNPTLNGASIGIGHKACNLNNKPFNVAIGVQAGEVEQGKGIGSFIGESIAVGYRSGQSNQHAYALAIGSSAGNSNQQNSALAIGYQSGATDQSANAIALGSSSGNFNQSVNSIGIGTNSGNSNQGINSIGIGVDSALISQGNNSLAIGAFSGVNNQGNDAISLGHLSGRVSQQVNSIAIGHQTGDTSLGAQSVAIGHLAGYNLMGANSVAIGHNSGVDNMSIQSVAIGNQSGQNAMGTESVAIGNRAGRQNLGSTSIAIGDRASDSGGSFASTIVINGTGSNLNPAQASSTYIKPIRSLTQAQTLHYDDGTGEITRANNVSLTQGANVTITGTYPAFTIAATGGSSPAVFGGLIVSQPISVSTPANLIFTTQVATGITATTSGFTCIFAGWYNIDYVIRLTTNGTAAQSFLGSDLILRVNGVLQVVTSIEDAGSPYESAGFHSGGCLLQLIAGDTVSFTCETTQLSTSSYSLTGRVSIAKVDTTAPAPSLLDGSVSPTFNNVTANKIIGSSNVSIELDNTTRLRFNAGSTLGTYFVMRNDELNVFNGSAAAGLYLNYNGAAVYHGNPPSALSDDRVKFNETNITNGLEVIRKLSPERYTKKLPTQTIGTEEAGFIAQEVMAIPELKFAVKHPNKELIAGDPNTRYYALEYDSIFTYAVAGLKQLDTIVQNQAQLISSLEARLLALENKK